MSELLHEEDIEEADVHPPVLKVVPKTRSLILIQRPSSLGEAGYWDQEKDLVVGPDEVELQFIDYFDFSQIPIMDFRFCRCRIVRFPSRVTYEGREALIEAVHGSIFHDD